MVSSISNSHRYFELIPSSKGSLSQGLRKIYHLLTSILTEISASIIILSLEAKTMSLCLEENLVRTKVSRNIWFRADILTVDQGILTFASPCVGNDDYNKEFQAFEKKGFLRGYCSHKQYYSSILIRLKGDTSIEILSHDTTKTSQDKARTSPITSTAGVQPIMTKHIAKREPIANLTLSPLAMPLAMLPKTTITYPFNLNKHIQHFTHILSKTLK